MWDIQKKNQKNSHWEQILFNMWLYILIHHKMGVAIDLALFHCIPLCQNRKSFPHRALWRDHKRRMIQSRSKHWDCFYFHAFVIFEDLSGHKKVMRIYHLVACFNPSKKYESQLRWSFPIWKKTMFQTTNPTIISPLSTIKHHKKSHYIPMTHNWWYPTDHHCRVPRAVPQL